MLLFMLTLTSFAKEPNHLTIKFPYNTLFDSFFDSFNSFYTLLQ